MRRLISLLLSAVMLVSLLFGSAVQVFAEAEETDTAETTEATETTEETTEETTTPGDAEEAEPEDDKIKTSEECLAMLKEYEGFSKYPYHDYGQYTVGYGTRCPSDMLSYYMENGITEEEAEQLLRNMLEDYERDVHTYMEKYGLEVTQNRFDALILFSYNCGSSWMFKGTSELHKALIRGADEEELLYRFTLWCTAGGSVLKGLIRRRMCETNLYVNGVYSTTVPENYCYVIFNANGGNVSSRVQAYLGDSPEQIKSTAEYEGHTFLGWFTEKDGGTQITELDASLNSKTLYAQWEPPIDNPETDDGVVEEGEENKPGQDAPETQQPETEQPETDKPAEQPVLATVEVTSDDVNYRKGPGTNYTILGQKFTGDILQITQIKEAGGLTWGQFAEGWIALRYTTYEQTSEPENPEPEQNPSEPEQNPSEPEQTPAKGQMGTVNVNEYLNIRQQPGTGYALAGQYGPNDRVEILEQKAVGATMWGRTDRGWISMDYVILDKEQTQQPETNPEDSKPEDSKPEDSQTTTSVTGVVNSNEFLRIRSGPGTNYDLVGYLYAGDRVTITEIKDTGSMSWGKIDRGWISMYYITLDTQAQPEQPEQETDKEPEKEPEQTPANGRTGTVKVEESLRVRTGPGTSYAIAGFLKNGEKVTVTEEKTVGVTTWGKVEKGWISLDYVVMDDETPAEKPEDNEQQSQQTITGIVNSNDFLRVRSGPGTNYDHIGYVYAGDKLTIVEQKTVGGAVWGKIAQGWVSMDYVTVIETPQAVTKTITANCLNVRSGAGTGFDVVGYLYAGTKVEVTETKTVNGITWGKIATGWISMEYTK